MQVYKVIPSNPNVIMVSNTLAVYGGLTVDTRDVGTLCQNAGNKWSKYKPVRFGNPLNVTDWWRDASGYCGLDVKQYTTMALMYTALRGGVAQWDYLKPRGLVSAEYFRLLDFVGYDVDATPPYSITALKDTYYIGIDALDAQISVKTSNPGGLLLSDLGYAFNLADMYLGLSFVRSGQTNYAYLTSTNVASTPSGALVSTPTTGMTAGTYDVSLFFAEFSKLLADPDITNNFFPTFGGYKTVTLKVFTLNITLIGSVEVPMVNYNVSINNSETIGFTLMNCYIIFRYGTRTPSDPEQSGEGQVPLGNINCPVGSTQVLSGQILNVAYDFVDRGGRLYFTTTSGSQFNKSITL
jgi:hypothetical protein